MADTALARQAAPARDGAIRWLQAALLVLLAIRLALSAFVAPIGDEAYYWLWGRHPDLSYFDHPPLHAWLQGLIGTLFGWNLFALRLGGWLSSAATVWVLWLWARRLYPEGWERPFWIALVVYFASPLFFIFSAMMFTDHLLVPLALGSLYAFAAFFERWERGEARWRQLYVAAALLGLAALAKYNAAFLALGVALYVLAGHRRRQLLISPHFWLAPAITLALFSPVLVWNLQHGLASFGYHLVDRQSGLFDGLNPRRWFIFFYQSVLYLSPFLLWPAALALLRRPAAGFAATGLGIARIVFVASTLVFSLIAATSGAGFYWNILAFAPIVPYIAGVIGARVQLWLHVAWGTVLVGGVLLVNYAVLPVTALVGRADSESAIVYGWDRIVAEVAAAEAAHAPGFLAASRYTLAAQLAFARGRDDVTALAAREDQFDYWFDAAAHAGQTALILTDRSTPLDAESAARFAGIEEVARFRIERFGHDVNELVLYLGRGFAGAAPVTPAR